MIARRPQPTRATRSLHPKQPGFGGHRPRHARGHRSRSAPTVGAHRVAARLDHGVCRGRVSAAGATPPLAASDRRAARGSWAETSQALSVVLDSLNHDNAAFRIENPPRQIDPETGSEESASDAHARARLEYEDRALSSFRTYLFAKQSRRRSACDGVQPDVPRLCRAELSRVRTTSTLGTDGLICDPTRQGRRGCLRTTAVCSRLTWSRQDAHRNCGDCQAARGRPRPASSCDRPELDSVSVAQADSAGAAGLSGACHWGRALHDPQRRAGIENRHRPAAGRSGDSFSRAGGPLCSFLFDVCAGRVRAESRAQFVWASPPMLKRFGVEIRDDMREAATPDDKRKEAAQGEPRAA